MNNLSFQVADEIAIVTIQRPKALNALNTETLTELHSLFEEIKTDSSENKKPHYHPYPKVPFYQILSEFEDRIDFKDIASISIYHPEGNNHD